MVLLASSNQGMDSGLPNGSVGILAVSIHIFSTTLFVILC